MAPQVLPAAAGGLRILRRCVRLAERALQAPARGALAAAEAARARGGARRARDFVVGDAYRGLQRTDVADALPTVEGALWRAVGHACTDDAGDESWRRSEKRGCIRTRARARRAPTPACTPSPTC